MDAATLLGTAGRRAWQALAPCKAARRGGISGRNVCVALRGGNTKQLSFTTANEYLSDESGQCCESVEC